MDNNGTKPKKIITPELREKMNAGRKRAMEERKKKKEAEKEENKQKKASTKKDLDHELAGLKQQKDAMETKKKTMEHRKSFRNKMRNKSVSESEPEPEPVEPEPEPEPEQHNVRFEIDTIDVPEPEPVPEPENKDFKIFKSEVKKLENTQVSSTETKRIFNKLTDKYDVNLNITENLKAMSEDLKQLIKDNIKQIKTNNQVIEKEEASHQIIDKTLSEVKIENKYKSQLASLMRLR